MLCPPRILKDPQRQARGAKKIRRGPQQRGRKSQAAASPLPSWGPKRGPAFSGIPNAKRREQKESEVVLNKGEQNQKFLPHPGPKDGGKARSPLNSVGSPMRSKKNQKSSPTNRNKIRSGYMSPPFLWAYKRAAMLRHPCILGDPRRQARAAKKSGPQQRGTKSKLPNPAFSGFLGSCRRVWVIGPRMCPARMAWLLCPRVPR